MPGVESFFAELSAVCAEVTKSYSARALIESPDFTPFRYINAIENRLTEIIADLLDPAGHHGQRDLFLREFLSLLPSPVGFTWPVGAARIRREQQTFGIANDRRRIDLMIDFGDVGIGIECKPWPDSHTEMPAQLEDYRDHLRLAIAATSFWSI